MSVRLEIEWKGMDGLKEYLERTLPNIFQDSIDQSLNVTADNAVERAKQLVPIDTGALQRSIRKERRAQPAGNIHYTGVRAGGYIVNPKTGRLVNYAAHVEYGTSRQRPQPFMRPALKWAMDRLPNYFWRILSRRVERG